MVKERIYPERETYFLFTETKIFSYLNDVFLNKIYIYRDQKCSKTNSEKLIFYVHRRKYSKTEYVATKIFHYPNDMFSNKIRNLK